MAATGLDSTGYPTQTYFSLPQHYTIGEGFAELSDAAAEAGRRLIRYKRENEERGSFIPLRVAIDEREKDNDGDRPVRRFYVMLTEKFVETEGVS